ncbi:hypothetical protein DBR37_14300 [Herminiimonas sp. KBW02]|nr:hypothetical protein DBR37_14300 [Herminiimonas sp. KBW02]
MLRGSKAVFLCAVALHITIEAQANRKRVFCVKRIVATAMAIGKIRSKLQFYSAFLCGINGDMRHLQQQYRDVRGAGRFGEGIALVCDT